MTERSEFARVDVEIVPEEELSDISVLARVDTEGSGISFHGRVDSILGSAFDVLKTAGGTNLYRVEVPEGYSLKDLVASKGSADAVRAVVKDSKGHLNGDVSLTAIGISPAQVASMGLAAAAVVVGQAYMTEINKSLHSIDEKLDVVIAMIVGEQRARLQNSLSVARSYAGLYDDYRQRPTEAFQAARNEIEKRYNDAGDLVDWVVEQVSNIEGRARETVSRRKNLEPLLAELHSYEEQFGMCLEVLSALAMTRMYYDGEMSSRSAGIEQRRVSDKYQRFLRKRQRVAGVLEMKIGALKGAPVALPHGTGTGPLEWMFSQTPRAAAKRRILETKVDLQYDLRQGRSRINNAYKQCQSGIDRVGAVSQSVRTLLTDGKSVWLIDDASKKQMIDP